MLQSRARLRLAQHRPEDALADAQAAAARARRAGDPPRGARRLARRGRRGARGPGRHGRGAAAGARAASARRSARHAGRSRRRAARARPYRRSTRSRCSSGPSRPSPAHRRGSNTLARWSTSERHSDEPTAGPTPASRSAARSKRPTGAACVLLARRAREELNSAGARPRRTALSGPGALTPAEHRVATLAAHGHTQPRDRRAALHHATHRGDTPHPRLPETRHRLTHRARRRPRSPGHGRRARARPLTAATRRSGHEADTRRAYRRSAPVSGGSRF